MKRQFVRLVATAGVTMVSACKGDGPSAPPGGKPTQVVEINPATRSAPANTIVSGSIIVAVQDTNGVGIKDQVVTFEVLNGGGFLIGQVIDTTDASGQATAPQWQLGKTASQQTLRALSGQLPPRDIKATVQTNYSIAVRFYDAESMTPGQQQLFTNAAQRIMGIVTGDVTDVQLTNQDVSSCLGQSSGTTVLTEVVDDIIIYATISNIDGPGTILASAGPCFVRNGATNNKIPVLGVMRFDSNDLGTLSGNGSLQEVITHEMLHVLGVGALWGSCGACFGFVSGAGTLDPQYTAPEARAACQAGGGTATCANSVPLEGCATMPSCQPPNGGGTRDSHWRESTFTNELMTGFINPSPNPLSGITIGSLTDMGYIVNTSDNDSYTLSAIMASLSAPNFGTGPALPPNWEKLDGVPLYSIDPQGKVRLVRKAK